MFIIFASKVLLEPLVVLCATPRQPNIYLLNSDYHSRY